MSCEKCGQFRLENLSAPGIHCHPAYATGRRADLRRIQNAFKYSRFRKIFFGVIRDGGVVRAVAQRSLYARTNQASLETEVVHFHGRPSALQVWHMTQSPDEQHLNLGTR